MNAKTFLSILAISIALFCIAIITQYTTLKKENAIIKQNDKEILVKKYEVKILPKKNLKEFKYKIDSTLFRYPPNKILYDGIIVKARHNPHEAIIKITKQKIKNGKKYKITTYENVIEYLSCSQIAECESNIGKRIVITKVYYPKEKIYYKLP